MNTRTIGCETSLVWVQPGDDDYLLMELDSDGHEYNFRWSKEAAEKLLCELKKVVAAGSLDR